MFLSSENNSAGSRLLSLDLFRGWTIIGMIIVNNPGSWTHMYSPLKHAEWDGWTPTDLIFPFFLWISGFASALSLEKKLNVSILKMQSGIIRRSLILIVLGLFLSGFPFGLFGSHVFSFETWRFPGVLQRIGICYFISASLFLAGGTRLTLIASALFLLTYGLFVELFPVPGSRAGILSPEGNAFQYFDSMILASHVWSGSPAKGFDPEGILSTLTAAATMQFGILSFQMMKYSSQMKEAYVKKFPASLRNAGVGFFIFLTGSFLALLGLLTERFWPINKNLWSISYVFFTAGAAQMILAILFWIYDLKKFKYLKFFPDLYGKNAIFVFVISALTARLLIFINVQTQTAFPVSMKTFIYDVFFTRFISDPFLSSLMFSLVFLFIFFPPLWFFNKNKIFIRI